MTSMMRLGKTKRVQYTPEQMAQAIQSVRDGMGKKAAARLYGVPKTTLLDKLSGRVPELSTKPGPKPALTSAEETALVNYAFLMSDIGYPLTSLQFRHEVKRILDIDGRKTDFKDNLPGTQWFSKFQKRHPEMSSRTAMNLGHERALVNLEMIQGWYDGMHRFLQREVPDYDRLIHDPRRIFNADESGFPLAIKSGKVLAMKGSRHVYNVVTNTKTQITVMACFNAYGEYVPPLILYPGERFRDVGLDGFPEAIYSHTENGWMDSAAFVEFLKVLLEFAKKQCITFPIMLLVDGHSTHMTLKAAEFCKQNDIILYCLLPNATHVLQACDIGFFSPMKSKWEHNVRQWQMEHIGVALSKRDFPGIFRKTWYQVATYENASHGFRRSGMFPLSSDGIDKSKLGPSKMVVQLPTSTDSSSCPATISNLPKVTSIATTNSLVSVSSLVSVTPSSMSTIPSTATTDNLVATSTNINVSDGSINQHDSTSICYTNMSENPSPTPLPVNLSPVVLKASTSRDEQYVSPAFSKLRVPEPVQKKKSNQIREKLPKALSGTEALKMLKEREEKKQAEQRAKELRKQEREVKKLLKEKDLEIKRKQRELREKERLKKKTMKEQNIKDRKKIKSTKRKREMSSSDSDSDADKTVPLDDTDSDNCQEEFDVCPGCHQGSGLPSLWVLCDICHVRWHIDCGNCPEFHLLDTQGRKDVDFVCPDCQ